MRWKPKVWCYQKTNYPKLFQFTYWGTFEFKDKYNEMNIINNRNNFVESYEIKKQAHFCYENSIRSDGSGVGFDHLEYYRDNKKAIVIINSPYKDAINEQNYNKLIGGGFKEINPLYSNYCYTFIIVFSTLAEYKKWLKSFNLVFRRKTL